MLVSPMHNMLSFEIDILSTQRNCPLRDVTPKSSAIYTNLTEPFLGIVEIVNAATHTILQVVSVSFYTC
jgi:hypothetical protein